VESESKNLDSIIRDGQKPESDWSRCMAFFVGFGVESFVNLLELERSRSLVSNFKIETKNDASVNCDFVVIYWFPKV